MLESDAEILKKYYRTNECFNFVIQNANLEPTRDLLIGFFFDDDKIVYLSELATMAELAVLMGLFPSKGQARKNGWDGAIPDGYTEKHGLGKMKKSLFVWKPTSS